MAKFVLEIETKDRYAKPLAEMAKSQKKFNHTVNDFRNSLKDLQNQSRDVRAYEVQRKQVEKNSSAYKDAKKRLTELGKAINTSTKVTKTQQREFERLKKETERLKKSWQTGQTRLNALKNTLNSAKISTENLAQSKEKLALRSRRAQRELDQERRKLEAFSKAQRELQAIKARGGEVKDKLVRQALVAGASALPLKFAADFETAMVGINKVANFRDRSGDVLSNRGQNAKRAELERLILTDAAPLGLKPTELAGIVEAGLKSNIPRAGSEIADLKEFATLASKMAIAFDNLTIEQAGADLAAIKSQLGLPTEQLAKLADAINSLGDNTAATTGSIVQVLKAQAAPLQLSGLGETQSASLAAAVLAASGDNISTSQTAVKNLALSLTAGDAATGRQQGALAKLGITDTKQLARDMQQNSVGTIIDIFERVRKQDKAEQSSIMMNLFGKESIGAISPLLTNMADMKKAFEVTADETKFAGSMNKEFAMVMDTTNQQTAIMLSSFSTLAVVIGDALLPAVNLMLYPLAEGAKWLTQLALEFPTVTQAIVGTVAALGAMKMLMTAWKLGTIAWTGAQMAADLKRKQNTVSIKQSASAATMATRAFQAMTGALQGAAASAGLGGAGEGRTGRKRGRLGKLLKGSGKLLAAAPLVGTAVTGLGVASDLANSDEGNRANAIGSAAGMAIGGALGAFGGPIGIAIGSALGSTLGGFVGDLIQGSDDDKKALPQAKMNLPNSNTSIQKQSQVTVSVPTEITINGIDNPDAIRQQIEAAQLQQEKRLQSLMSDGFELSDKLDQRFIDSPPRLLSEF